MTNRKKLPLIILLLCVATTVCNAQIDVGTPCLNDLDCSSLANSRCSSSATCDCRPYYYNEAQDSCQPVVGRVCEILGNNSLCSPNGERFITCADDPQQTRSCQCETDYVRNSNNECVVGFGSPCSSDSDCAPLANSRCSNSGKCDCLPYYYDVRGTCLSVFEKSCDGSDMCTKRNETNIQCDGNCTCATGYQQKLTLDGCKIVTCSTQDNNLINYGESYTGNCTNCFCLANGTLSCSSICPALDFSPNCQVQVPIQVTVIGDQCGCKKWWCKPQETPSICKPGWTKIELPRRDGDGPSRKKREAGDLRYFVSAGDENSNNNKVVCVKNLTEVYDWSTGQEECGQDFGFLPTFNNSYYYWDIAMLNQTLHHMPGNAEQTLFWTGGHLDHGKFYWENLLPIPMSVPGTSFSSNGNVDWLPNQPLNKNGNCVAGYISEIPATTNFQRQLNISLTTHRCDEKLPVTCQNRGFVPKLEKVNKCKGNGWLGAIEIEKCYQYNPEPLSYEKARQKCQSQDGSLATSFDSFVENYLYSIVPNDGILNSVGYKTYFGLRHEPGESVFVWEDGTNPPMSFVQDHFPPETTRAGAGCYVFRNFAIQESQRFTSRWDWENVPCNMAFPFVCEKNPEPLELAKIIKGPQQMKLLEVQLLPKLKFTCHISGDFAAINWLVNGKYISLPKSNPSYLATDVAINQISGIEEGYYQCEVWSYKPYKRTAVSEPALVFVEAYEVYFAETPFLAAYLHFTGQIKFITAFTDNHELWNAFEYSSTLNINQELSNLQRMFRDVNSNWPYNEISEVQYRNDSVILDFNMRVNPVSGEEGDSSIPISVGNINPLDPSPQFDAGTMYPSVSKILQTLRSLATYRNGSFYNEQSRDFLEIDPNSIKLFNREYCPEDYVIKDNQVFLFPRTNYGETAETREICTTTGISLGTRNCTGNFTSGARWADAVIVQCLNEKTSTVTNTLRKLSQVVVTFENVGNVSQEVANLTSNPTILTKADVIYGSQVTENVCNVRGVDVPIATEILKAVNNLLAVNETIIQDAENTFLCSSRITQALEKLTDVIQLDNTTNSVALVQPEIALWVWDSYNADDQVLGIQYSSNMEENLSNNSFSPIRKFKNLNISDSDTGIVLPLSAVRPTGTLHLFNKTENVRFTYTNVLEQAMSNVSLDDCAQRCKLSHDNQTISELLQCVGFEYDKTSYSCSLKNKEAFDPHTKVYTDATSDIYIYTPEWAKKTRISFLLYRTSNLFASQYELKGSNEYGYVAFSRVISAKINTRPYRITLDDPLVSTFIPINRTNYQSDKYACGYWDYSLANGLGDWSTEGCWYNGSIGRHYVCMCNHLTNFAILLDIAGQGVTLAPEHKLALEIIGKIGCSLSIVGLSLTILTFFIFRKFRKGRSQQTLFNLALALLCSMIVFLAGVEQTQDYIGCIAVAVLLHYFILVSFMWMLVEGILQYLRFVKVMGTYIPRFMLKAAIPAWGIPAVICAVVLAINYDMYKGGENYCWLGREAFYYAFLIPVGLILLCNIIIFILVLRGITCARAQGLRTNQSEKHMALLQFNCAVCCLLLLGGTWVFGFLAIEGARLAFHYIFGILNSLQGLFIFIFFNVREKQVRDAWFQLCCKKRYHKQKYEKAHTESSGSNTNTHSTGTGSKLSNKPAGEPIEFKNYVYGGNGNGRRISDVSSGRRGSDVTNGKKAL